MVGLEAGPIVSCWCLGWDEFLLVVIYRYSVVFGPTAKVRTVFLLLVTA